MQRYFIELFYNGAAYAGFQAQDNANTIQAEVEKALQVYFRHPFNLTGSSRTDAGVHAHQNFFHLDDEGALTLVDLKKAVYHLNAILPADIVIRSIMPVSNDSHARFSALSRSYTYTIYQSKNPFLAPAGYYYPYNLDLDLLNHAAALLKTHTDFESFSKRNSQVHTFECNIMESSWEQGEELIQYRVTANRFLRGMVRGLVGTMLKVGREKITLEAFEEIILKKDLSAVDFSVPAHGLMLKKIAYPFTTGS